VGPNGQTYSDTVTIIVLSKFQMDNKLRAKWDGMKTAMTIMDVPKATSFFLPESQERYSGIFTALGDSLPQVAQNMQDIQMIYLEGNVAQYRIRKFGPFGLITFYIYFIRDGNDGIWRIQQF